MTLLRLNHVSVHVADVNGSGNSPAPEGLHVWLDVPGGAFEFNHFVVHDGHLAPAGAAGTGSGQLDTRWAYWSVWSTTELSVGSTFTPVTGFGYPLPARISQRRLILPNTRPLTVHWFNLSEDQNDSQGRIANQHNSARRFYEKLHIDVSFDEMRVPSGTPWPLYFIRSGEPDQRRYDVSQIGLRSGFSPFNPDFGTPHWLPSGRLTHAVIAYWVEEIQGMGAIGGISWPALHVSGAVGSLGGEAFHGPPCAYFFMRRAPLSNQIEIRNPFAHEMGHCLLYDPGLGRRKLEAQQLDRHVKRFLGRLNVEGPPRLGETARPAGHRLYNELFEHLHAPMPSNLMAESGGTELLPWQVAVIRASRQIGDGP